MAKFYYRRDVDPEVILGRSVAVLGYGNQGRAQALNLRDQGVAVTVGARMGNGRETALKDGFDAADLEAAAAVSDVVMMTLPDESMAEVYRAHIEPSIKPGKTLMVCHGFAFNFGFIHAPSGVDVCMVAPKGSGASLRGAYEAGLGLAGLVAVHQDASGEALSVALSYAWGIGCARSVIMETTFKEECETDLFGEQAVLCGGIPELIKAAFETLVEAGYSPEAAYFECMHEAKLITDLMYERGLSGMREAISDTAEWGGYQAGKRIVDDGVRKRMKKVLDEVQSGKFAKGWVGEAEGGKKTLHQLREEESRLAIEEVGKTLRDAMKPR